MSAEMASDGTAKGRPGIATHYRRYSISNALVLIAGFVSFTVLTRLLDYTQFGLLRYYESLMLLGVAVAKFGVPHAIVRFYPYHGDRAQMRAFGTNLVALPMLLSIGSWALVTGGILAWAWWREEDISLLAWCALLMVPVLSATAIVQMVIRASERSDIVMMVKILGRLMELAFVLGAVIWIQSSALAVYGGKLIAGVLLLAWLLRWLYRHVEVDRSSIDMDMFRAGLMFGIPLMAHELAFGVLANIDRVLLKQLTGDFAAVGIYAIGYSLAMQLNIFIDATLYEAFTPVVTRSYEAGGNSAVRALKQRVLLPMTYAVVGIITMLLVSGRDVLVALSGPEKAESGEVFVVVGITISTYALFAIANYGLQLKKQTMRVLAITLAAAAVNVGMNFLLIPRMGYMGAAWATAIAYGALSVAQFVVCPKGLARMPELRVAAISLGCGSVLAAVAMATDLFGVADAWLRLLVAGLLFLGLYALPVLLLDARMRAAVLAFFDRSK